MKGHLLLRCLAAGLCAGALLPAGPALAQAYPSHPVKIIVPFAAGGPADVYGRFLAQRLGESLGQAFVVEDRPGAGAVIGTDLLAKSPPDGYTLLLMSNTHTVNETLLSKTVADAGVPNYEATIWLGLMAPRGTPKAVVDKLNAAVSKIVSEPEVQQQWAKQGATAMVMSPPAFDKYVHDDIRKWAHVIQTAHIKAD